MTQLADKSIHMSNFTRLEEADPPFPAPPWLDALRKTGIDRFDLVGFPTRRQEEWRHTDVSGHRPHSVSLGPPACPPAPLNWLENFPSAASRRANWSSSTANSSANFPG